MIAGKDVLRHCRTHDCNTDCEICKLCRDADLAFRIYDHDEDAERIDLQIAEYYRLREEEENDCTEHC